MKQHKIYLDVCCLCRAFDDQKQDRIRLETEALDLIMRQMEAGRLIGVGGDVIHIELSQIADVELQQRAMNISTVVSKYVSLTEAERKRAWELKILGFGPIDALHLASAEAAKADVFLSTDDQLVKMGMKQKMDLKVKVANPLTWLREEMGL